MLLNLELPNLDLKDVTVQQQKNISAADAEIKRQIENAVPGTVGLIATADFARKEDGVFSVSLRIDGGIGALTCKNDRILVTSTWGLEKSWADRFVFRALHPAERLLLQGHEAELATSFKPTHLVAATGNAFAVNQAYRVVIPSAEALAVGGWLDGRGRKRRRE